MEIGVEISVDDPDVAVVIDAGAENLVRRQEGANCMVATPFTLPKLPTFSQIATDPSIILPFMVTNALHVLGALAILAGGFWLSGRADMLVNRLLRKSKHVDEMLRDFFASIARYFILTMTMLAVLSQFGIQTTSLVAVIGAASLAIGLALQGTLSNLAAGVMLLIFRPFANLERPLRQVRAVRSS